MALDNVRATLRCPVADDRTRTSAALLGVRVPANQYFDKNGP